MFGNNVEINNEEIRDLLYDCPVFDTVTKDYGGIEVLDIDSVMEDFVPQLIEYINERLEKEHLVIE